MTHRAVVAGAGVAEALDGLQRGGAVLSAYRRAVNLEAAGGRLLALHGTDVALSPFGIVVEPAPPAWPAPGTPARRAGGLLIVGGLTVDLAWLPPPGAPWPQPPPALAWGAPPVPKGVARTETERQRASDTTALDGTALDATVLDALAPFVAGSAFGRWWQVDGEGEQDRLTVGLRRRARAALAAIRAAVGDDRPDRAAITAAARPLVGLGPGATPAGDDLLLGLLGAWRWLGPHVEAAEWVAEELAAHAARATTRLAAELYYHLARGRLSPALGALLAAIASGERAAVVEAAGALAQHGATSGRDTIAGVCAYLLLATGRSVPIDAAAR